MLVGQARPHHITATSPLHFPCDAFTQVFYARNNFLVNRASLEVDLPQGSEHRGFPDMHRYVLPDTSHLDLATPYAHLMDSLEP